MTRPVLVYDGDCGFCRRSIRWIQTHDRAERLEYLPRQSADRIARYPQLDATRYQNAIQLVCPDGTIRSGAAATATALTSLPDRRWQYLGRLLQLPGIRQCARLGYQWIANNRHRFGCADETCKLP